MNNYSCKFCGNLLEKPFLSLGNQPLCNNYIKSNSAETDEKTYPLEVFFCPDCFLVQLAHTIPPGEIFEDYAYLSSFSDSWLNHAKKYSKKVIERFKIDENSFVVEIASNDGYLLKNFLYRDIPTLGIEPATNASAEAIKLGIPTVEQYFDYSLSEKLVKEFRRADLIISNNVYAHVPKINDFTSAIKNFLSPNGVWTIEFPYLKNLLELNQFDTIYHEHYFYFSLNAVRNILEHHGLKIFDVEKLHSHGGSLRIYATHSENQLLETTDNLDLLVKEEIDYGLCDAGIYDQFDSKIQTIKTELLNSLNSAKAEGKIVAGYGAAGKANTLLNFCGIDRSLIEFIVDRNPLKQNTLMPGSRIPVYDIELIEKRKPDYVVIFPWNLKKEIMELNKHILDWGGKFILPIPQVRICEEVR